MISPEQLIARKHHVGSSDAPAIVGVDPYKTAYDVYLEKTDQAEGFAGNEATERGNLLEPVLLNWAERKLGATLLRDMTIVHENGILAANFDGIQPKVHNGPLPPPFTEPYIVEAKTASTATNPDEWGEDGTDEVPERVIVQAHHQMYVAGPAYRIVYVPVMLPVFGRFDFRLYKVDRSDDLAELIASRGVAFWRENVERRVPPNGCLPSIEILKRIRRQPAKVVTIPDELADAWITTRKKRLQAEKDEEAAERELLTALQDAEAGDYAGGMITYMSQTQKRIDLGKLESEYTDIAAACRREISFRVLRTKKWGAK